MMSHMGVFYSGIFKGPLLVEMISNGQTLMLFHGKMMTISIAGCIEDRRYIFLSCTNANCDLVLTTCDISVGVVSVK